MLGSRLNGPYRRRYSFEPLIPRVSHAWSSLPPVSQTALELFFDEILEGSILQREVGIHPFELRQFALDLLESPQIRRFQPTVFGLPIVIGRIADPMLPTQVFDFDAPIPLLQDRDNLGFAESTRFHVNLLGELCQKALLFACPRYGEAYNQKNRSTGRLDHIYKDPYDADRRLNLIYGDLNDSSSLNKILRTIALDEIYNLGAQSHVRVSFDVPEYTADVTGLGTLRLLEAIRETGFSPEFYQASSSG